MHLARKTEVQTLEKQLSPARGARESLIHLDCVSPASTNPHSYRRMTTVKLLFSTTAEISVAVPYALWSFRGRPAPSVPSVRIIYCYLTELGVRAPPSSRLHIYKERLIVAYTQILISIFLLAERW